MTEKNVTPKATEIKDEVKAKTNKIKDFFKKHKKTILTIGGTALTTTAAILWLQREPTFDGEFEDEEEEFDTED